MKIPIILGILLIVATSCSSKKTSFENQSEFQNYLNDLDNGFISSTETSDLIIESKLIPALDDDPNPQFSIQLRIKRKDGGPVLELNDAPKEIALEREGYLSFEFINDVEITTETQIYRPVSFHYERNYGIKPSVDLLLQFENIKPKSDVELLIRDQLFEQGLIRINLEKELFNICHVEKK